MAIAGRLLPQANPDFESAYQNEVTTFWLELDENNVVQREVALDASGRAVAAAPLGENCGIFFDLGSAPDGLGPEVDALSFEKKWQEVREVWVQARFASKP